MVRILTLWLVALVMVGCSRQMPSIGEVALLGAEYPVGGEWPSRVDVGADVYGKELALSVDLNGYNAAACRGLVFTLFKLCLLLRHILLHFLCLLKHRLHVGRAAAHSLG